MTFDQRLVTLMNLFKISSSELAHGINVDASLISRWKTGERRISANSPHIYNIVIYFQSLKAHDYQKNYLERIISTYLSSDDRSDGAKRTYALIKWLVSECPEERNTIDDNPIFENSPIGIAINRNGKILYANQVYVDIFGYSSVKELQGKNIIDQVAPDCREDIVHRIQQREQNRFMPLTTYEIDGFRKDGTIFPILVEVKNVNLQDGPAFASFVSDITDQKYLEEKLSRQVKLQELILDISKSFTRAAIDDLESLIDDALMRIGSFDNDDRSFIYIYSDSNGSITNVYEWCAEGISYERSSLQEINVSALPWSQKNILQQECICIPQVSDLPENAASEKDFIAARGVQSLIAVPMICDSKLIGYLGFDSIKRTKIWPEEAIMMLESVAQIITNGLIQKKYALSLCESENYYRTISNLTEINQINQPN